MSVPWYKCFIFAGLGDRCKNDTDCIQPGSPVSLLECVINNCECKAPYYEVDGQCTISTDFKNPNKTNW